MQGDDPPSGWKGLNNELENDLPDLNLYSAFISFDSLLCLLISLLSCLPSPLSLSLFVSLFLSPLFSFFRMLHSEQPTNKSWNLSKTSRPGFQETMVDEI